MGTTVALGIVVALVLAGQIYLHVRRRKARALLSVLGQALQSGARNRRIELRVTQ